MMKKKKTSKMRPKELKTRSKELKTMKEKKKKRGKRKRKRRWKKDCFCLCLVHRCKECCQRKGKRDVSQTSSQDGPERGQKEDDRRRVFCTFDG